MESTNQPTTRPVLSVTGPCLPESLGVKWGRGYDRVRRKRRVLGSVRRVGTRPGGRKGRNDYLDNPVLRREHEECDRLLESANCRYRHLDSGNRQSLPWVRETRDKTRMSKRQRTVQGEDKGLGRGGLGGDGFFLRRRREGFGYLVLRIPRSLVGPKSSCQ